jgi:hypothetical protein
MLAPARARIAGCSGRTRAAVLTDDAEILDTMPGAGEHRGAAVRLLERVDQAVEHLPAVTARRWYRAVAVLAAQGTILCPKKPGCAQLR